MTLQHNANFENNPMSGLGDIAKNMLFGTNFDPYGGHLGFFQNSKNMCTTPK